MQLAELDGAPLLKHILARFLLFASRLPRTGAGAPPRPLRTVDAAAGLSRMAPHWVVHTSAAKGRWLGRPLLDVLTCEFRERSARYYVRRARARARRRAWLTGATTACGNRRWCGDAQRAARAAGDDRAERGPARARTLRPSMLGAS
jgi:hypothetical protein